MSGRLAIGLAPVIRSLAIAPLLFASVTAAQPDNRASASGQASAAIIDPLTVRALADLDFGTVAIADGQAGEVIVHPNAEQSATYMGQARPACISGASCTTHPASFTVRGTAGRNYSIALPASVEARGSGPTSRPLSVTDLTVSTMSIPNAGPAGQLDAGGGDLFAVGGTLRIDPGTAGDRYRADVPVIVTYR